MFELIAPENYRSIHPVTFQSPLEFTMRTSLARLGLGFGNLGVTVRGTTKYHISPLEQKAFAGAFSQGGFQHLQTNICQLVKSLFPRSSQHPLEDQEVRLHCPPSLHHVLPHLYRDREGAREAPEETARTV